MKLCDFSKTSMRFKSSANDGLSSGKVRFASPMRLRRNFFVFQSRARSAMKGRSQGRFETCAEITPEHAIDAALFDTG